MQEIKMNSKCLMEGSRILEQKGTTSSICFSKKGTGIYLPQLVDCKERLLTFYAKVQEEHSLPMHLLLYVYGEEEPALEIRFGLLPQVKAMVCIDLQWLDGSKLFPEAMPGTLKIVCHGRRVFREEISKVVLSSMPCFHDVTVEISDMTLTDDYPENSILSDEKLVDCLGQDKRKNWEGKTEGTEDLKRKLYRQYEERDDGYPFEEWSEYGGLKKKKLREGTGFFTSCKAEGRWWLTDPLGYAFFSMGPDCVGVGSDCRVDGMEGWLDWLPDRQDIEYGGFYHKAEKRNEYRDPLFFSYTKANLYRAFGSSWYEKWKAMMEGQLKRYGMNTLGNWSEPELLGRMGIPYVTSLPEFPSTRHNIFRDFPDVFSEEYLIQARRCARALAERKDDPLMIGYFLRNEPGWAFVDNLVLAEEVLYNPERTACKEALIEFLRERYRDIEELNRAWNSRIPGFDSLYQQQKGVSAWSEAAKEDMREFSRRMMKAYIEIPVRECRKVDPNHMILGMRWAWISNPDLVTGWENFDVFSINCYAADPTAKIQHIVDLGVDLPVMIGEFHFGALDAGLSATGLEGVRTQWDRGIAYQYYCESVAAHPNGVGCHYFQCYDQFMLGRFDGENYNIGLFDICSCIYPHMMEAVRRCSGRIYDVAAGRIERSTQRADMIPMVAY